MKIKHDYITNSSTTCFCGWGIQLDYIIECLPEKIKREMYNEYVEYQEIYKREKIPYEDFLEDDDVEIIDFLYRFISKENLSIESYYDADIILIGTTAGHAPKNKTINEIIEDTQIKLNELGFDQKVEYIEEAWRD